MELTQQDFLEELLAPRIESWNTFTSGVKEFFPNAWNIESSSFYQQNPEFIAQNSSLLELISPVESSFPCPSFTPQESYPFLDTFITAPAEVDSTNYIQEEYSNRAIVEEGEGVGLISTDFHGHIGLRQDSSCFNNKVKMEEATSRINIGHIPNNMGEKKSTTTRVKKVEGQPSKNLMAERRRRKRLNDRLSMLRSIVPKISKMDRTSILGDTIDYMKELIDKIHRLREDHEMEDETKDRKLLGNYKELKPNEALVRNPPKFDVERRNEETRIEICCAAKPGLVLSTVSTIEALGLDVQQCVVSCFSDFSMRASCSEATEHRTILRSEDVKQALFKTAGYGGRCL
ncbi:transcription factor bHLH93-like [Nicotiana tabacum]|uniref:Transcription factor bHLH93-like n=1 Tax=Nicotiana tabacum TaxID=4097 RepID=A0A1S4DRD4_TOBAC|nr:transcription factor bHLH93-like [Nicotiana tomentosiformis]XP_016515694.1 PREDICTED: transcription factor bHLH93-like [Nicotiana tabacum]